MGYNSRKEFVFFHSEKTSFWRPSLLSCMLSARNRHPTKWDTYHLCSFFCEWSTFHCGRWTWPWPSLIGPVVNIVPDGGIYKLTMMSLPNLPPGCSRPYALYSTFRHVCEKMIYLAWGFKMVLADLAIVMHFLKLESVTSWFRMMHREHITEYQAQLL